MIDVFLTGAIALGFLLLAAVLYGPRVVDWSAGRTYLPVEMRIPSNSRWDNGLFCIGEVKFLGDCNGGWLGLYIDRKGNKHPDAHYSDLRHAIAGIPDVPEPFTAPARPPGYPTFGHPKFRCYENCAPGGWSLKGWS